MSSQPVLSDLCDLSRLCGSSYIGCIVDNDVLSVNTVESEFYS
jgi:hypothetical protein